MAGDCGLHVLEDLRDDGSRVTREVVFARRAGVAHHGEEKTRQRAAVGSDGSDGLRAARVVRDASVCATAATSAAVPRWATIPRRHAHLRGLAVVRGGADARVARRGAGTIGPAGGRAIGGVARKLDAPGSRAVLIGRADGAGRPRRRSLRTPVIAASEIGAVRRRASKDPERHRTCDERVANCHDSSGRIPHTYGQSIFVRVPWISRLP